MGAFALANGMLEAADYALLRDKTFGDTLVCFHNGSFVDLTGKVSF